MLRQSIANAIKQSKLENRGHSMTLSVPSGNLRAECYVRSLDSGPR